MHRYMLQEYDNFCKSLRLTSKKFINHTPTPPTLYITQSNHPRNIYLLPQRVYDSTITRYSGIPELEYYIFHTKDILDNKLSCICKTKKHNLSLQQQKIFNRIRHIITVKPADKSLGIVIMDTENYLTCCCNLLKDNITYRKAKKYPLHDIKIKF